MIMHLFRSLVLSFTLFVSVSCLQAKQLDYTQIADVAAQAYVWGYPLVVAMRTKNYMTQPGATPLNEFYHSRELLDSTHASILTPTVDTLYSTAWLDLSQEPILLHVPATGNRYYVVEALDPYTNVFANIGQRTTGAEEGWFGFVGPDWNGFLPPGVKKIMCPSNTVWLIGRILVDGGGDVGAVRELQDRLYLETLNNYLGSETRQVVYTEGESWGSPADVDASGASFFVELLQALEGNPPPLGQRMLLQRFASVGIGPNICEYLQDPLYLMGYTQGVWKGEQLINDRLNERGPVLNGWATQLKTGVYGADYLSRAVVARQGLGANVAQEQAFAVAEVDSMDLPLTGQARYVIHLSKKQIPPVDGFWTITAYDMATREILPNPTGRYAVGSRTDGLKYNDDGSLDIVVQAEQPAVEANNWLPAPLNSFYLILRMYAPKAPVLKGSYLYPIIERVGS